MILLGSVAGRARSDPALDARFLGPVKLLSDESSVPPSRSPIRKRIAE